MAAGRGGAHDFICHDLVALRERETKATSKIHVDDGVTGSFFQLEL
jgi:hypothetical protein